MKFHRSFRWLKLILPFLAIVLTTGEGLLNNNYNLDSVEGATAKSISPSNFDRKASATGVTAGVLDYDSKGIRSSIYASDVCFGAQDVYYCSNITFKLDGLSFKTDTAIYFNGTLSHGLSMAGFAFGKTSSCSPSLSDNSTFKFCMIGRTAGSVGTSCTLVASSTVLLNTISSSTSAKNIHKQSSFVDNGSSSTYIGFNGTRFGQSENSIYYANEGCTEGGVAWVHRDNVYTFRKASGNIYSVTITNPHSYFLDSNPNGEVVGYFDATNYVDSSGNTYIYTFGGNYNSNVGSVGADAWLAIYDMSTDTTAYSISINNGTGGSLGFYNLPNPFTYTSSPYEQWILIYPSSATPSTGFTFGGLSLDSASSSKGVTINSSYQMYVPANTTGNITITGKWIPNQYTLSVTPNNTNITVKRTSSPYKGAATGTISSGTAIYYGDVLTVECTAKTGYTSASYSGFTSGSSVAGNVNIVGSSTRITWTASVTRGTGVASYYYKIDSGSWSSATTTSSISGLDYASTLYVKAASATTGYVLSQSEKSATYSSQSVTVPALTRIVGTLTATTSLPNHVASLTTYVMKWDGTTYTEVKSFPHSMQYGDKFYFTATASTGYNNPTVSYGSSSNPYTWTGNNNDSIDRVTMSGVTAGGAKTYAPGFNVSITGKGTIGIGSSSYTVSTSNIPAVYDSKYTLTATPSTGYSLTSFTVAGSSFTSGNSYTYASTSGISVSATFSAKTYALIGSVQHGSVKFYSKDTYTTEYEITSALYDERIYYYIYPDIGYNARSGYIDLTSGNFTLDDTNLTASHTFSYNAVTYTIAYDANGGSGTTASSSHTYDVAKALTSNGFSKTGYLFDGWSTVKDGPVVYIDKQSVSNLSSSQGATVTLYAHWNPITYYVSYNANKGTGSMENSTFTYDISGNLRENTFERTGYTFGSWNTNQDGTGVRYEDEDTVSNLCSTQGATLPLYAQWNAKKYVIRGSATHATITWCKTVDGTYTDELTEAPYDSTVYYRITCASGYETSYVSGSFVVTYDNFSEIQENVLNHNFDSVITPIVYTITYVGLEDTTITPNPTTYTIETESFTLNNPSKDHYHFTGWSLDGGSSQSTSVTIAKGSIGNRTYTAHFEGDVYAITLNKHLGSGGTSTIYERYNTGFYSDSACTQEITTSSGAITSPTRNGFVFQGYYTSDSAGTQYITSSGLLSSDVSSTYFGADGTLYAHWNIGTSGFLVTDENKISTNVDELLYLEPYTDGGVTGFRYDTWLNVTAGTKYWFRYYSNGVEQYTLGVTDISQVYNPLPAEYPIATNGSDGNPGYVQISNAAQYKFYCYPINDFTIQSGFCGWSIIPNASIGVSINGGAVQPFVIGGKEVGVESTWVIQNITVTKGDKLTLYFNNSVITPNIAARNDNNIIGYDNGYITHNTATANLYIRYYSDGQDGYYTETNYEGAIYGAPSGKNLFVKDSAGWVGTGTGLAIKFTTTSGEDVWTNLLSLVSYSDSQLGYNLYEITIPDSANLYKSFVVYKYNSSMNPTTDKSSGVLATSETVDYSTLNDTNYLIELISSNDVSASIEFTNGYTQSDRTNTYAYAFKNYCAICEENRGMIDNQSALALKWGTLQTEFNLMSLESREIFTNATADPSAESTSVARVVSLYDYIVLKYDNDVLPDYAGRIYDINGNLLESANLNYISSKGNSSSVLTEENHNTVILIIICSSCSLVFLSGIALLYVHRKRHSL